MVIVSVRYDLKFDELENVCISIKKPRSKPFLIVTWYGPPNSVVDKFNHLETLQGKLDAENIEYYVVGDLNCGLSSTVLDHSSRLLIDIAETFDLQQLRISYIKSIDFRLSEENSSFLGCLCRNKGICSFHYPYSRFLQTSFLWASLLSCSSSSTPICI